MKGAQMILEDRSSPQAGSRATWIEMACRVQTVNATASAVAAGAMPQTEGAEPHGRVCAVPNRDRRHPSQQAQCPRAIAANPIAARAVVQTGSEAPRCSTCDAPNRYRRPPLQHMRCAKPVSTTPIAARAVPRAAVFDPLADATVPRVAVFWGLAEAATHSR